MTLTINLPPATLRKVQAEAAASGKDVDTVVSEALEVGLAKRKRSLTEVLKPINEAIQASGMTPEEAEALFEQELSAMRAERRSRKKTKLAQDSPAPSEKPTLPLLKSVEEVFREYFPGGLTVRDEANALVAWAFRNGPLEDLHAGKYSELLEDKSLSRITDAEMKELMLNACRKMEELLRLKASKPDEYYTSIAQYTWRYCRRWER